MESKSSIVLTVILSLLLIVAACREERAQQDEPPNMPSTELQVTGGDAFPITGEEAGRPLETISGPVNSISYGEWREMEEVPSSGLFFVETDYVPKDFTEWLESQGFELTEEGTVLSENDEEVTVFIDHDLYGIRDRVTDNENNIQKMSLSVADPYPFRQFSWYMWWVYDSGFCRDYTGKTRAQAWGPKTGGTRPHTKIEYIEVRAEVGYARSRESCPRCDREQTHATHKVGCWWPASIRPKGNHYANWKEGGFSATRTWSW